MSETTRAAVAAAAALIASPKRLGITRIDENGRDEDVYFVHDGNMFCVTVEFIAPIGYNR
jgi:hypothetical protein